LLRLRTPKRPFRFRPAPDVQLGTQKDQLRVLSCLPGRVALDRSENLKLIYFQLSRRIRSMTVRQNEHGLAERRPQQRLANGDRPRVHLLEIGLQERGGDDSHGCPAGRGERRSREDGARINARMACLSEKMQG
jgi:hypothetical protein